jgi:hypothetical protein
VARASMVRSMSSSATYGNVVSRTSCVLGKTGVKRRWKKMVWRMPTITDQQPHHGLSRRHVVATFDNVFDVGPVGCDLEGVLWWAAGVHVG